MKLGDRNGDVAWWQSVVGVPATGIFDPLTSAATRLWQMKHGLRPDGIVGPLTLAAAKEKPMQYTQTTDLDENFFPRLLDICAALGCDPRDLLAVMMSESGVKATAHNPHGDASGLIQFMPATLKGLHFVGDHNTFRQLSATEQLGFVERYYAQFPTGKPWSSAGRLYQATFLPGTLGPNQGPATVVCARGGKLAFAYEANPGFDTAHKGSITVGDLTASTQRAAHGSRWTELLARLAEARGSDDVA